MEKVLEYVAIFLAVIIILTLHEWAHSFAAVRCGDNTPKYSGRLSVNPLRHFDIIGLLAFVFVGFGWAKPVPINPYNFKKYRSGLALTASAGVIMNYLLAFIGYPLFVLFLRYVFVSFSDNAFFYLLYCFLFYFVRYNLSFCAFNLIPLPPLDGFRLVDAVNRRKGRVFQFFRQYGYYILLGLILLNLICEYIPALSVINVLGYLMTFAQNILGAPITFFWDRIFGLIYD